MLYTGYAWTKGVYLCEAVSTDLIYWEKTGPVFKKESAEGMNSKSACVVCSPESEAVKINGKDMKKKNIFAVYDEWSKI